MKRFLKRYLRSVLPPRLIDWIKHRMEARLCDGADIDVTLETSAEAVRCTIDRSWSFLAPPRCQGDLHYHTLPEGRAEMAGIAQLAREGGILFDIGAHAGIISAMFCTARAENKAYSFEPSPISQERLKEIRILNHLEERMFLQPVAIGETSAKIEMLIDPGGGYVQTQRFEHSMWDTPQKIEVTVESIPEAALRLGVVPDCIKLDIEGYEYEAIKGAQSFLSTHKPAILLELHLNYLEERGRSAKAVVEMLCACGYSFYTYAGNRLAPRALYDSPLQGVRVMARGK